MPRQRSRSTSPSRKREVVEIRGPRLPGRHTHGTGCTLSPAIAANLAKGIERRGCDPRGPEYLEGAIRTRARDLGAVTGRSIMPGGTAEAQAGTYRAEYRRSQMAASSPSEAAGRETPFRVHARAARSGAGRAGRDRARLRRRGDVRWASSATTTRAARSAPRLRGYEPLAVRALERIAAEAAERMAGRRAWRSHHRVGRLADRRGQRRDRRRLAASGRRVCRVPLRDRARQADRRRSGSTNISRAAKSGSRARRRIRTTRRRRRARARVTARACASPSGCSRGCATSPAPASWHAKPRRRRDRRRVWEALPGVPGAGSDTTGDLVRRQRRIREVRHAAHGRRRGGVSAAGIGRRRWTRSLGLRIDDRDRFDQDSISD